MRYVILVGWLIIIAGFFPYQVSASITDFNAVALLCPGFDEFSQQAEFCFQNNFN
jgi:hypothetical protein